MASELSIIVLLFDFNSSSKSKDNSLSPILFNILVFVIVLKISSISSFSSTLGLFIFKFFKILYSVFFKL